MSFSGPFNISKATPTTSTTNTNTVSISTSPAKSGSPALPKASLASQESGLKIFTLSPDSPKVVAGATTTGLTDVTSQGVRLDVLELDIKDILGKYDLEQKDDESTYDVDLLEEKMKQFSVKKTPESMQTDTPLGLEDDENPGSEKLHQPEIPLNPEPVKIETSQKGEQIDMIEEGPATVKEGQSDFLRDLGTKPQGESVDQEHNSSSSHQDNNNKNNTEAGESQESQGASVGMQPYVLEENAAVDLSAPISESEEIEEFKLREADKSQTSNPRSRLSRNNSIGKAIRTVDPREQHQISHRPFDFHVFFSHLRSKSAEPIVKYITSFLVSFTRQANSMTAAQMIRATVQFRVFINEKFEEFEPFALMDEKDVENSNEGIEKLIMNRLYDVCFSPAAVKKFGSAASVSAHQDVQEDRAFDLQVEKFSWVSGVHLDVDLDELTKKKKSDSGEPIDHFEYAVREMNKMNEYRAPRDKIICILNSCKIIFSILKIGNLETNADAFIPLLILVIMRAKIENLVSNLRYIERFRGEEWLNHGETSYYMSSMQGAISFIQNIQEADLTISHEEFAANMEAWEAHLKQNALLVHPQPQHSNDQGESRQTLSPLEVIFASAEMFTKSILNLMSPAPQERQPIEPPRSSEPPQESGPSEEQVELTFSQMVEMFPDLDKAVLRDIVVMKNADVDSTLDVCLQLMADS